MVSAHHYRSNRKKQAEALVVVLAEICLTFVEEMAVLVASYLSQWWEAYR